MWSELPVAKVVPSGLNATDSTEPPWPDRLGCLLLSRGDVPELDHQSGRRERRSIGAHRDGIHSHGLFREPPHFLARGHVDHPGRETQRHSEVAAVGRERQRLGAEAILVGNLVPYRPCRRIPEDQSVIIPAAASVDSIRAERQGPPSLADWLDG